MAASFVDADYVRAFFGVEFTAHLWTAIDGEFDEDFFAAQVRAASTVVQAYAAQAGYSIANDSTDEQVRLATLGTLIPMACGRPDKAVPLPESWAEHPAVIALNGIRTGDMRIVAQDPTAIQAVGAFSFTESDPTSDTSLPKRTTKTNLSGF